MRFFSVRDFGVRTLVIRQEGPRCVGEWSSIFICSMVGHSDHFKVLIWLVHVFTGYCATCGDNTQSNAAMILPSLCQKEMKSHNLYLELQPPPSKLSSMPHLFRRYSCFLSPLFPSCSLHSQYGTDRTAISSRSETCLRLSSQQSEMDHLPRCLLHSHSLPQLHPDGM